MPPLVRCCQFGVISVCFDFEGAHQLTRGLGVWLPTTFRRLEFRGKITTTHFQCAETLCTVKDEHR